MKPALPRLPSPRVISLSLLLVVVFYVAYIYLTGQQAFFEALAQLQTVDWLILLGCSLANYLLRFVRWQYFLQRLGYSVAIFRSLAYYLAGFSLTITPGKAGETIRSLYLHHHQVRFSASIAAFFSERFLDVTVVTALALLSLFYFPQYQSVMLPALAVLMLALLLFAYGKSHGLQKKILPLITWQPLHRLFSSLLAFLSSTRELFSFKSLLVSLSLGVMAWTIQAVALLYLLQHYAIELDYWVILGIYAASLLAGAVSFIPGGVGTTEAAMAFLLMALGVEQQMALIIPLLIRISSLWFAFSLGVISVTTLGLAGIRIKAPGTRDSG